PTVPRAFETDRTYVVSPRNECMFYCIASPHPSGGYSVSVVCHDETLERYPWLAPPADNVGANASVECGWDDEHSAPPERTASADELARRLEGLFREEMPAFHDSLDGETFRTARVNRRVTWLDHGDGDGAAFSAEGGLRRGDVPDGAGQPPGDVAGPRRRGRRRVLRGGRTRGPDRRRGARHDPLAGGGVQLRPRERAPAILSEAFRRYGAARPAEVIPVQRRSADRSNAKNQTAKRTTPHAVEGERTTTALPRPRSRRPAGGEEKKQGRRLSRGRRRHRYESIMSNSHNGILMIGMTGVGLGYETSVSVIVGGARDMLRGGHGGEHEDVPAEELAVLLPAGAGGDEDEAEDSGRRRRVRGEPVVHVRAARGPRVGGAAEGRRGGRRDERVDGRRGRTPVSEDGTAVLRGGNRRWSDSGDTADSAGSDGRGRGYSTSYSSETIHAIKALMKGLCEE
ncbi:hypothetical protein THAOC_11058, partial [Thalassiosira oceanica]